jgi:hypothetical protein
LPEVAQVSRIRAVAAASVVLMAVMLPPASAVAQEGLEDPSAWVTTTDPWSGGQSADARLTVTTVWVTTHDGFDRIVFETQGDGEAGWAVEYGPPVRVTGAVALRVTLTGIAPPGEGLAGAVAFVGEVPGPAGGVVRQVVSDALLEGQHTFFVGLDGTLPYRVLRVDDPKGIVIDVVHGAATEADDSAEVEVLADGATGEDAPTEEAGASGAVPVGGVETGWGGLAAGSPISTAVGLGGVALLVMGASLLLRRRSPV